MNQERKSLAYGGSFGGTLAGILWLAISLQYGFEMWMIVPVSLLGGCFGWLACDFADAKCSAKTAWKQIVEWKPDTEWWRDARLMFFSTFAWTSGVFFWVGFFLWDSFLGGVVGGLVAGILFGLWMLWLVGLLCDKCSAKDREFFKTLLIRWNVVTMPLSIVWYAGKGMMWVLARVPFAIKTAGKFWWHAFKLAHSDKRRICFIGTTLGAAAGLFCASANEINLVLGVVLPGIFGAAFSLGWYEVVAIRWLGIKSA
jgi:hypothetical protein